MSSCNYLDIVPDNIATIDYAFRLRSQAEKYLFTCYSYLPEFASWSSNPALLSGDEIWFFYPYDVAYYGKPPSNWEVARGNQGIINPYLNYWDGGSGGKSMFQAIRDCNTFLENIEIVPDMDDTEKRRWTAEVKFLKAYYHWYLLRMYGPIPVMKENIPISAGVEEVKRYREPIDSCFDYIVKLIDTAAAGLPDVIQDPVSEMGRVTRPIALSIKARILMTAASPLFNGNPDYADFTDNRGIHLFNTAADPQKWQLAADACKEAIDACAAVGHQLYHFNPLVNTYNLGPEMKIQMDIRNAICEKWNSEVIWGATNSLSSAIQKYAQPIIDPSISTENGAVRPLGEYAPTLKVAEQFYTKNGLPIQEDKTWDYENRYNLDTATAADRFYIQPNYVTAALNFNREPRFYADLGFDGGIWYGQGKFDDENTFHVEGRLGGYSGNRRGSEYSITGYYAKKLVNFLNVLQTTGAYQIQSYPWPIIRLADLYLYYAEALNEVNGPTAETLKWIDLVRERAGIPTVEDAWTNYAKNPGAYQSKDGFRKIIHQERLIEMAFEGNRYWDLRRWKEAERVMSQPVKGWNVSQQDPLYYYQVTSLFNQTFKKRDYFWPIEEKSTIVNTNLVQNPGW
ncbi:RagB/SusD family nutrient uptake outer membrane protein [Compostibacter hankyongensis]|uniref:RagB/SusD family nutrient uptake outer membrane protein n=2 Tax=Compostibacter hankyongensis TaxID=1007089 RepID=A0ABP8FH90_9BACT